ncbi:MAG: hypothetical protein K2M97_00995, partial [Muribaculaceae bacterium]|nr:hypothetical protein [Muribaculaceae bacterium]
MEAVRTDATFDDEQDTPSLSMSDLWKNIRARWTWYVISFVVVFGLATLYLLSAQKQYTRSIQVLLKSDSSQFMTTDLEDLGVKAIDSDILDEMFILTSPAVIETVVEQLGLNYNYSSRDGLRKIDLYNASPLCVELVSTSLAASPRALGYSLKVEAGSDNKFTISGIKALKNKYSGSHTANLGDTIDTPIGLITVAATRHYDPEKWEDRTINFSHVPVKPFAKALRTGIKSEYDEDLGSVITLSLTAPSARKADDILAGVVNAYNERWMNDRNKISVATSEFIDDRLNNIERDLTAVEGNITDFQSRHAIVDMAAMS